MAQEDIHLHNFFGIVPPLENDSKQQSHSVAADNPGKSVKDSWLTEEVGQEGHSLEASQSTSVFDESVAAPVSDIRDLWHKSLRMDVDGLDSSRLFKKSRVEKVDEKKRGHDETALDDLNLTMQPPRLISKSSNLHPSLTTTVDIPTAVSKTWDCNALGILVPGRASHKSLHADNVMMNPFKDNNAAASLLHIPPADEGSRTGLKGSSVGSLLNRAMAGGPQIPFGRSTSSSRGAGSESTFVANQENTPITRQLTIFYGGQAHVFEDVSSDKAEAIMTLAGSSGRSWSTVYSPRPKSAGTPSFVSEGSLSTLERERAMRASKPTSTNVFENSCGIHNAFNSLFHKDLGRAGDSHGQEQSTQFSKWASDMQMIAG